MKTFASQESIPVGCVPSAAVTMGGGGTCLGDVPAREGCVPAKGCVPAGGGVPAWGEGGVPATEGVPAHGGAYPSMH